MATAQLIRQKVGIRNVLVATDFSRRSQIAVDFGLEFAHQYGAQTYILHVLPVQEFALAGPEALVGAQDVARRDLLELKQQLRASSYLDGDDVHLLLGEGDIAESILDCARERNIDLIVLGTHGRKTLSRALMGSVAEQVFRHSTAPVLTLGPALTHAPSLAIRKLLVPVDFTLASKASIRYACSMAREHNASIMVQHVIEKIPSTAVADAESVKAGVEQRLADLVKDCAENTHIEYKVDIGKVAPAITRAACELGADLVLLGVHKMPRLLDRMRWQVAYDVVREAPCPVLTLREPA